MIHDFFWLCGILTWLGLAVYGVVSFIKKQIDHKERLDRVESRSSIAYDEIWKLHDALKLKADKQPPTPPGGPTP